jgi:hypothetical protein
MGRLNADLMQDWCQSEDVGVAGLHDALDWCELKERSEKTRLTGVQLPQSGAVVSLHTPEDCAVLLHCN